MELTTAHWQYTYIYYNEFYPYHSRNVEGMVINSFMPISDMPAANCWKTFYRTYKFYENPVKGLVAYYYRRMDKVTWESMQGILCMRTDFLCPRGAFSRIETSYFPQRH